MAAGRAPEGASFDQAVNQPLGAALQPPKPGQQPSKGAGSNAAWGRASSLAGAQQTWAAY
jgi:hypothetical protein